MNYVCLVYFSLHKKWTSTFTDAKSVIATGYYFTGDAAYRTKEGYYQLTGRMDDVLNISGHRLGTAEIEDAMVIIESKRSVGSNNLFL